ncbi:NADH-quinone oxidoreductase subunit L [Bradyrhizobium sp.]|uniref:NADH-quinone oxidoreductase subunit L n=1 Tax=Bradyrhizobium sp. TaxID=376 RepID=UPI003919AA82
MMTSSLWLAMSGPAALLAASLLPAIKPDLSHQAVNRMAAVASGVTGAAAFATAIGVATSGALHTPALAISGIGFGLYLDSVSATMFCLVSFIGAIVLRYSFTYMDGDPGQIRFIRLMCLTLAAVLTLAISGNLLQFTLAWSATSLALHRLLVFYAERPAAVIAARKKFLASRLGDLFLVAAMLLLYAAFGSLDYESMFSAAQAMRGQGAIPLGVQIAAVLMVFAGLLKSAQFPVHGWLIEVMETPTPVSALLHAGIINAGGFLVLRFTDVISLSLTSMDLLAVIGGFTALFGSVVMLTQTSIKVSLAWSTIAQMGFMMMECGLGAFAAALLHIVAHSLYKAHAFLSSGSVIDIARASWTPSPGGKPHPFRLIFSIAGVFALGAVLLLGLIHLVANGIDERPNAYVVVRTLALAAVVAAAYFGLQLVAEQMFAGALPKTEALRGPLGIAIVSLIVLSFATVTFLQGMVPKHATEPRWQALYVHVANGFYVNTITNRLVLHYWPGPAPTSVPVRLPIVLREHP